MKQILATILALSLLLPMAGCSDTDTVQSSSAPVVESADSSEEESSSEEPSSNEELSSSESPSSVRESSSEKEVSSSKQVASSSKSSEKENSSAPAVSSATSSKSAAKETVSLTFMEGSSLAKMMDVLEQYGVAKKADLLKVVSDYDFSYYPLVAAIPVSSERCFKLEGYLFPDTYEFYKDEKPEDAIGRFLKVTEKKLTQEYRDKASELGYTVDQIITLASIVEKEVGDVKQMSTVASVFYNRLSQGMKLQSDATINYVERSIKPYITGDINRYNSYYNTYKCKALPAGPICTPGIAAIKAVLYPEQTDYLFFVSDKEGNYYYAATYEEHLVNCETAGVNVE